jgi:hypothetical protein
MCPNGAAHDELRTAGKAAAVVLQVDRPLLTPTWDDVADVTAEVVDEHGVVVPSADNRITFAVTGHGAVVAVDNQDIASHEPFQGNVRSAFQGRCIAIVRANAAGRIAVSATAASLKAGSQWRPSEWHKAPPCTSGRSPDGESREGLSELRSDAQGGALCHFGLPYLARHPCRCRRCRAAVSVLRRCGQPRSSS